MITGLLKENMIKQTTNMKTTLHRIIGSFFIIALVAASGNAQTTGMSKFGATPADSIECVKNQSLYAQHYNQKNYDMALEYWRQNFTQCPASSQNIYTRGETMFLSFYEKTKDKAYIDTLVMILDQRAKYYGNKINMDIRKANYLAMYSSNHPEMLMQASDVFTDYIKNDPGAMTPEAMMVYMKINSTLFMMKKMNDEELMGTYSVLTQTLEKKMAASPNDPGMIEAKAQIEGFLISSGVANCDNLVPLITKRFAEAPQDLEALKKSADLLKQANCIDSDIYYKVLNSIFPLEKTASTAYGIAEISYKKEDLANAEKYYVIAVELETDPTNKSNYLTKLATLELNNKDYIKARDYARQVLEITPSSGTAYFLIGSAYMSTKLSDDEFENRTVFWVAVDNFIKAKNADPVLADRANESIAVCTSNFPKVDDAFFRGILLAEGDPYTVKGWINERTTARFRK